MKYKYEIWNVNLKYEMNTFEKYFVFWIKFICFEFKHTFKKVYTKETASDIAMENMKIVYVDRMSQNDKINLLYSVWRSTFDYKVEDEPENPDIAWKLKHMISIVLKLFNSP